MYIIGYILSKIYFKHTEWMCCFCLSWMLSSQAIDWIWNNWFVFRKVLSIHQSPYQHCHNNVKRFCVFLGKSHVYQRASVQRRLAKEFIFIFVQNTYFQNQNNCFQNSVCERIEGRQRKSSLQARQDWRGSCFSIHTPIQSCLLINSDVNIISKSM